MLCFSDDDAGHCVLFETQLVSVIKYCSGIEICDQKMCICGRAEAVHSPFKRAATGRTPYKDGIKYTVLP